MQQGIQRDAGDSGDVITEVTTENFFSRLSNSIAGIIVGISLVVAGCALSYWNEGNYVRRLQSLAEGKGAVISLGSDKVDPGNEGRLVQLSGPFTVEPDLVDEEFAVEAAEALSLSRSVEMYLWKQNVKEEKKKSEGACRRPAPIPMNKSGQGSGPPRDRRHSGALRERPFRSASWPNRIARAWAPMWPGGKSIFEVRAGEVPAEQMFQALEQSNHSWLWGLRLLGWFLVCGGIAKVLEPLVVWPMWCPLWARWWGPGSTRWPWRWARPWCWSAWVLLGGSLLLTLAAGAALFKQRARTA